MDPISLFATASSLWNTFTGERNRQDSLNTKLETFNREDNAVQRRMADMKKAGINPVLSAGSPAQSSNPTIQKGGEIDPTKFLAPLQAKLLVSQTGVTNAQKLKTLTETELIQKEIDALTPGSRPRENDFYRLVKNINLDMDDKLVKQILARAKQDFINGQKTGQQIIDWIKNKIKRF